MYMPFRELSWQSFNVLFCFKLYLDDTIDITIQQTLNVIVRELVIKIVFY